MLQRQNYPFGFYSFDSDIGAAALAHHGLSPDRLPVAVLPDGRALVAPSNVEIAGAVGARTRPGEGVYDVVVVGGGPAGLAAAVSACSEGLRTSLVEPVAMGGQAGTSSMIRNYLGFPRGSAARSWHPVRSSRPSCSVPEMAYGSPAISLTVRDRLRVVGLASGAEVTARAVVIATGVSYRTLDLPALERFNGVGIFYGAAIAEARSFVGGRRLHRRRRATLRAKPPSTSPSTPTTSRWWCVRRLSRTSMSDYLITEIDATPQHRGHVRDRGRRWRWRSTARTARARRPPHRVDPDRTGGRLVRPHRRRATHGVAAARRFNATPAATS